MPAALFFIIIFLDLLKGSYYALYRLDFVLGVY